MEVFQGATDSNGSKRSEPLKVRSVSTLSCSVLMTVKTASSYFEEIISVFSPQKCPPRKENGPDGIRTRICDCDRVPCSHYTTGPHGVSESNEDYPRSEITN